MMRNVRTAALVGLLAVAGIAATADRADAQVYYYRTYPATTYYYTTPYTGYTTYSTPGYTYGSYYTPVYSDATGVTVTAPSVWTDSYYTPTYSAPMYYGYSNYNYRWSGGRRGWRW